MGIGFYRDNNRSISMNWAAADDMVAIIHDLGASFDPNELLESNMDDDGRAEEIKTLLQDALANNKIGGRVVNRDSLGRDVQGGYRITVVGGELPIEPDETAWIQRFIDFCS